MHRAVLHPGYQLSKGRWGGGGISSLLAGWQTNFGWLIEWEAGQLADTVCLLVCIGHTIYHLIDITKFPILGFLCIHGASVRKNKLCLSMCTKPWMVFGSENGWWWWSFAKSFCYCIYNRHFIIIKSLSISASSGQRYSVGATAIWY